MDEAIIYYDFGMMGEIKSFTRERLLDLFYAVYEKDAKKVYISLISNDFDFSAVLSCYQHLYWQTARCPALIPFVIAEPTASRYCPLWASPQSF